MKEDMLLTKARQHTSTTYIPLSGAFGWTRSTSDNAIFNDNLSVRLLFREKNVIGQKFRIQNFSQAKPRTSAGIYSLRAKQERAEGEHEQARCARMPPEAAECRAE